MRASVRAMKPHPLPPGVLRWRGAALTASPVTRGAVLRVKQCTQCNRIRIPIVDHSVGKRTTKKPVETKTRQTNDEAADHYELEVGS